jgi:hypothetical protein
MASGEGRAILTEYADGEARPMASRQERFDSVHDAARTATIAARIAPRGVTRRHGADALGAVTVPAISSLLRRRAKRR